MELLNLAPEFQFTHPVWGATRLEDTLELLGHLFQFTHPVWGATRLSTSDTVI